MLPYVALGGLGLLLVGISLGAIWGTGLTLAGRAKYWSLDLEFR